MTETLTVALWATNLEFITPSLDDWLVQVETRIVEAQAGGARLLVLPEFACAQWLAFAPPDLALYQQVAWLASISRPALAGLAALSARYQIALLAGTMPFASVDATGAPAYLNRAWMLLPDGSCFAQDKLCLTPSERNPQAWLLTPGTTVNVIVWEGMRLAIVVCLDVEFTSLWARLALLDLDLVIVPAKTGMISGYHRVFGCAKARAIELQTVVCVVGAIGSPLGQPALDPVVGGAAAYLPCDASMGYVGIAAALEPHAATSGASPLLIARDLPVAACRRLRHGLAEAEVWPGAWQADAILFVDPASATT